MPVYNERNTIEGVIKKVISLSPKEIILVDDGSTDGTKELLKKLQITSASRRIEIRIVFHERNQGKGAAVRTALEHIKGEITAIQDADLEYNPEEIGKLAVPIIEGKTPVVYGSRFLQKPIRNVYKRYKLGNWFLSKLISVLCGQRITDSYTCYKVFKTDVIRGINLISRRFEIEAEITVKLLKKGINILELPISYNPRRLEEGKKIGWLDAVKGILTIIRYSV
ncbi:MAG: glycosyltransferase family 2 protein [Elusimicrobia bacterium]|nr:glycosyltransferase family 2 protein [Elusimicrobiota bacterium]